MGQKPGHCSIAVSKPWYARKCKVSHLTDGLLDT